MADKFNIAEISKIARIFIKSEDYTKISEKLVKIFSWMDEAKKAKINTSAIQMQSIDRTYAKDEPQIDEYTKSIILSNCKSVKNDQICVDLVVH